VDLLMKRNLARDSYTFALLQTVYLARVDAVRMLLDRGADINATDPQGRTALMYAAVADHLPADIVKLLIARGAEPNAPSPHPRAGDTGLTALDLAMLHGQTPIVDLLSKSGTMGARRPLPSLRPLRDNTIAGAVQRSLPLLQRSAASFSAKSGCVSCHNNSLAEMAVGLA